MADKESGMNLGALASNVIDLADRKIKPVAVKQAQDQPRLPPREKNYVIGPFRALKDQRINKTAAFPVLMAICSYTNRSGETWVGQQTIADIFSVTRQAIGKQVSRLIELGYLEIVQKGGKEYSSRMRVIFDPKMSLEEVKSVIPARLKPEIPPEVIISKEEARIRLKKIREARMAQPQKLHDNPDDMQPQRLPDDEVLAQPNGGLSATSVVAHPATSGGCTKEVLRYIRSTLEHWKKEKEKYGFATSDARTDARDACALERVHPWAIPERAIRSLLTTILVECRDRRAPAPKDLTFLVDMGQATVLDMIEGLPT